jgi:hypothetical protein
MVKQVIRHSLVVTAFGSRAVTPMALSHTPGPTEFPSQINFRT